MKVIRKSKKGVAFLLAAVLFMLEVISGGVSDSFSGIKTVSAETIQYGPEYPESIPATGGAIGIDQDMPLTGLEVMERTTSSISIKWDRLPEATIYYIYQYDFTKQEYVYVTNTTETQYLLEDLPAGKEYYFTVCGYNEETEMQGTFAMPVQTYTRPEKLPEFQFTANTATTISLAWEKVESATGYQIYRAGTTGSYTLVTTTTSLKYKDTGLTPGKTYRYMIRTYAIDSENTGEYSQVQRMTTRTKAPSIKVKGGHKRTRITWKAVTGASGYYVYLYSGTKYNFLTSLKGKSSTKYIHKGLQNGKTYRYCVTAYRILDETSYESAKSSGVKVKTVVVKKTSTGARLYKNKKAYQKSKAYKNCSFLKKKSNYKKSIIIPGMKNTNVAGFKCTTMVPQGIAFAKSYLLITAYDKTGEENSVIYVMKKSSKKLVATLVLPNKPHAGGITYDGTNIWITQGNTLRSIPYSTVSKAVKSKSSYYEVSAYRSINTLPHQAAAVTYYKGLLWVASYNELSSGYLGSYRIGNKTTVPVLTKCSVIRIATRVQGIAFTSNGRLILSRSCQTDSSKRGFLHQLDVYKPNLKKTASGKVKLGRLRKHITMPVMNEEIAVSGKYLYVNYESVAFSNAANRMDRISAFQLSAITKLK